MTLLVYYEQYRDQRSIKSILSITDLYILEIVAMKDKKNFFY